MAEKQKQRELVRGLIAQSITADAHPKLLEVIASIIVANIADAFVIDLVEDDGSISCGVVVHRDPGKQKVLSDHRHLYPLSLRASYGYPRVIKTGKSQYFPGVTPQIATRLFAETKSEPQPAGISVRSFVCVPLIAHDRTLGAMTLLMTDQNQSFTGEDLLFFEELGALIAEAIDEQTGSAKKSH